MGPARRGGSSPVVCDAEAQVRRETRTPGRQCTAGQCQADEVQPAHRCPTLEPVVWRQELPRRPREGVSLPSLPQPGRSLRGSRGSVRPDGQEGEAGAPRLLMAAGRAGRGRQGQEGVLGREWGRRGALTPGCDWERRGGRGQGRGGTRGVLRPQGCGRPLPSR